MHCSCQQVQPMTVAVTTALPTTLPTGPTTTVITTPAPTMTPGPLLKCDLNCFGGSAEPVALPGSTGAGDNVAVPDLGIEACRDFCSATDGCEGIVFGSGMCYGKKNIFTSRCQSGEGKYVTEVLRGMPKGVCGLFGDPHIVTFDNPTGGTVDQFSTGEYYLVKSGELQITGRFGDNARFPNEASTVGVAISGALLGGHTISVQYVGGAMGREGFKAFWDGKEILADFGSTFESENSLVRAEYQNIDPDVEHDKARHTIGGDAGTGALPSYRLRFLPDWSVYVLLGEESMNVVIQMSKQPSGQDGYCGNFNCDASDDTLESLTNRGMAARVDATQSLFAGTPAAALGQRVATLPAFDLKDCGKELRTQAEAACAKMSDGALKKACVYDSCASGSVSVADDDLAADEVSVTAEIESGEIMAKFFSGVLHLGGAEVPWQVFAFCGAFSVSALVGCMMVGRASRHGRYEALSNLEGGESPRSTLSRAATAAAGLVGALGSRGGSAYEGFLEDPSGPASFMFSAETATAEEEEGLLESA